MSQQQKCPHCGFVGYPETVHKENHKKFFLMALLDFAIYFFIPRRVGRSTRNRMRPSYSQWENFSTDIYLRCARCKQPFYEEDDPYEK